MSKIIEKREIKLPPSKINKDIIKKLGDILESESPKIYDELKDLSRIKLSEREYYVKYPEELEKGIIADISKSEYLPSYELISNSKNISSFDIEKFIETTWPSDVTEISILLGTYNSPKKIEVNIYLLTWRMTDSKISVSGEDSIWVNGITTKIEEILKENTLEYHFIINNSVYKILVLLITWFSIAFTLFKTFWPAIRPYLKEGIKFEFVFVISYLFFGLFTVPTLDYMLDRLFPHLEYGEKSTSRSLRKWIWFILMSSGLLREFIFRLLGLN